MNKINLQTSDLENICASTPVSDEHTVLLQKLTRLFAELEFCHVLTRGGWHRPGGLVDGEGNHIAHNLAEWLEQQAEAGIDNLIDTYSGSETIVTNLIGKTHYFVAQYGEHSEQFVQLEVEELQEVKDRKLFSNEYLPDDIDDLIDPVTPEEVEKEHVGEARYEFRRITDIAEFMAIMKENMVLSDDSSRNVKRFMDDWERTSSKESGVFCHHWVLSIREYTDAWGEKVFRAKPVSTYDQQLSLMKLNGVHRGSKLARLIHGFDHDIGYHMAWYFFMLSHREVPHQLAEAIHRDLMGAYDYLPARDLKVLKDWSAKPYSV